MNEQQLQQILTIQQAIAAAATAAVINSLLNPQQAAAANLSANNLSVSPTNINHVGADDDDDTRRRPDSRQDSPAATSSSPLNNPIDTNNRTIQDLLMQLQQQATTGTNVPGIGALPTNQLPSLTNAASAMNFNLNSLNQLQMQPNIAATTLNRLLGQNLDLDSSATAATAATSGNTQHSNQSPNKKLKRQHQSHHPPAPQINSQPFPTNHHGRSSSGEATSKSLHHNSASKSHSSISNISARNNNANSSNSPNSSSSSFLPNNVGLPRKLVRGQDVWLGRGAEQTRQILKCMWCGQSFRTLAEMTQHMKITQHYTNIISQEQITSWRQPEGSEANSSGKHSNRQSSSKNIDETAADTSSEKFNDSDREESLSNDDDHHSPPQSRKSQLQHATRTTKTNKSSSDHKTTKRESTTTVADAQQNNISSVKLNLVAKNRKRSQAEGDENDLEKGDNLIDNDHKRRKACDEIESSATNLISAERGQHRDIKSDCSSNHGDENDENRESLVSSPEDLCKQEPFERDDDDHDVDDTAQQDKSLENSREYEEKISASVKIDNEDPNKLSDNNKSRIREDEEEEEEDVASDVAFSEIDNNADEENLGGSGGGELDAKSERCLNENEVECDKINRKRPKSKRTGVNNAGAINNIKQQQQQQQQQQHQLNQSPNDMEGQKNDGSGDPLSALETMVEKSFDPRLRPGLASGGILQRLGIDEEVCPPWQHINYANWYAAAAYGHPMAAALFAAGINLTNGIKLNKNVNPKKNDDAV